MIIIAYILVKYLHYYNDNGVISDKLGKYV